MCLIGGADGILCVCYWIYLFDFYTWPNKSAHIIYKAFEVSLSSEQKRIKIKTDSFKQTIIY